MGLFDNSPNYQLKKCSVQCQITYLNSKSSYLIHALYSANQIFVASNTKCASCAEERIMAQSHLRSNFSKKITKRNLLEFNTIDGTTTEQTMFMLQHSLTCWLNSNKFQWIMCLFGSH